MLQQHHLLPNSAAFHLIHNTVCAVLLSGLLRPSHSGWEKKELGMWYQTLEESLGGSQMSLGDFCLADKTYQAVTLCPTAASLPGSSQQGWGPVLLLADPCSANQLLAEKRDPPSPRHLQPLYSCCNSFEGNLALYCQQQFMHICRCDTFAPHDLWEGKIIAWKVCQWYHLALTFPTSKCSTNINEVSLKTRAENTLITWIYCPGTSI